MTGETDMNLQVLVSTMGQTDHSILEKMNIQTDAIVINQCDKTFFEEVNYKNHQVQFLSFSERGVGLSRNNALMRATADICLFADDDVKYEDHYERMVINAFENNPRADVIIFNVLSTNPNREGYIIKKNKKISFYNCLRYPTYRIAVRISSIRKANIYFSLLFGGGAPYSCGEDSLFISECMAKKLKIFSCSEVIGYVSHEESTWFKGYTDKYFIDKGALYVSIANMWAKLLCLQFVLRHSNLFKKDKSIREAYNLMIKGIKEFNRREIHD